MKNISVYIILSFLFVSVGDAAITDFKLIEAANKAYATKRYELSIELLDRLGNDGAACNYDKANAYYKAGDIDKAIFLYRRAKGAEVDELNRLHNLGNAYFKNKNFKYAIKVYSEALKHGQDVDTKYNLKLAKKELIKQKKYKKWKKKHKNIKRPKKKTKKRKQQKKDNKNTKDNKSKDNKNQKNSNKKLEKQKKIDKQKLLNRKKRNRQKTNQPGMSKTKMSKKEMSKKEIRRLMKKMSNKKMPTLMYQVGGFNEGNRSKDVNPW